MLRNRRAKRSFLQHLCRRRCFARRYVFSSHWRESAALPHTALGYGTRRETPWEDSHGAMVIDMVEKIVTSRTVAYVLKNAALPTLVREWRRSGVAAAWFATQ